MSILNDALRKAARDRRTQAVPPTPLPRAHVPVQRSAAGSRETFTLGLTVGAVLVALGAGVTLAWFTSPEPARPTARTARVEIPLPTAARTPEATPSSLLPSPADAGPVDAPAPGATTVPLSPSDATLPSPGPSVPAPAAEPVPAQPPEDPALRIRIFIADMTIAVVRGTGADGRALINGRLIRVGDTVDPVLNLRLADVAPGRLVFEDSLGRRYTRFY